MRQRKADPIEHQSSHPLHERIEQLKQLFPEAVNEDGLDVDTLVNLLGKREERRERYNFTWAGKQDAILSLNKRSQAALKPVPDESLNWDSTGHLFIEGDNLEALKLLYKSYFGRVKMIYIDPPYNTGKDFVYPDNHTEPLANYLRLTGQVDEEGNVQTSNIEASGRRHSNWLSMMYPRLFLARQLLREDGVIFVSIDDNEVHNLRMLMNLIFGEENFVACLIWEGGIKNNVRFVSSSHDYILCFAKNIEYLKGNDTWWRTRKQGIDTIYGKYHELKITFKDDIEAMADGLQDWFSSLPKTDPAWQHRHYRHIDEKGVFFAGDISAPGGGGSTYDILHPKTRKPVSVPARGWGFSKEGLDKAIAQNRVFFGEDENKVPNLKRYLHETEGQVLSSVIYQDRRSAYQRLRSLFNADVFNNPKDENVIMKLIETTTRDQDIILDFFAGSATTAESVLRLNREDDNNRKFIMIQLPEVLHDTNREQKIAYNFCIENGLKPNIAEISKERIRRVIQRMKSENASRLNGFGQPNEDLGFRVFRLDKSSMRQWQDLPSETSAADYDKQMALFIADPLLDGWTIPDVIAEVAVKEVGFSLTYRVERVQAVAEQTVMKVIDDEKEQHFYICLDDRVSFDALKPLRLTPDVLFVFRDSAIDDTIVANLALACRIKSI